MEENKDVKEAREEGMKRGERKAKSEIIKELYKTKMPIEQIASIVKLEEAEVKEILNIK